MSSITTALRALALAVAALLVGTLLASAPSSAEPEPADGTTARQQAAKCNWQRKQCWGAVAFNTQTGKSGTKLDTRTKRTAMKGAMSKCRNREENAGARRACVHPRVKDTHVRNGCLYVAMQVNAQDRITDWAKGTAYNQRRARKRALSKLDGTGAKSISAYVCTTRHL